MGKLKRQTLYDSAHCLNEVGGSTSCSESGAVVQTCKALTVDNSRDDAWLSSTLVRATLTHTLSLSLTLSLSRSLSHALSLTLSLTLFQTTVHTTPHLPSTARPL